MSLKCSTFSGRLGGVVRYITPAEQWMGRSSQAIDDGSRIMDHDAPPFQRDTIASQDTIYSLQSSIVIIKGEMVNGLDLHYRFQQPMKVKISNIQ